jgi:catechol 2,3-dioxygenase-like lactoylglutathione lyase family enzyme
VDGGGAKISLQLAVADLLTTEAFYGGILELPVSRAVTAPGAPEHLILQLDGGGELIFVEEAAVLRVHPVLADRLTDYPKGVGMTLHFRVTEIEDISDALEEEGLEILYPLAEKPYGMKELWCFDPDGYLVALEEPWR